MTRNCTELSRRAGYLYVAVLFTSLIVSTMGLVALTTATLRSRMASDGNDRIVAELLASAAIEDAVQRLSNDDNWRSSFAANTESSAVTLGSGTYTWMLKDSDGNLTDDESDFVQIVGIGRAGRATVAESVKMYPTGSPLSSLEAAFHCQGNVTLGTTISITTNSLISSNGNITASALLSSIQGNAEAVGSIAGNVSGSKTSGVPSRQLPGSSALEYYLDNGTYIPWASLPVNGASRVIEKVVLSPTVNPFGDRNPEGIYVIDCAGQQIKIRDCRVVGTIVLLNAASNSSLEGSLRWDAAVANYPALLVAGDIDVKLTTTDLSEADQAINFNPNGTPFLGKQDNDLLDVYPSEINGLVYVSGRFDAPQDYIESRFRGTVICNSITANSSCRFNYRALIHDYPPPGFARGNPMTISPGSRRRETLP